MLDEKDLQAISQLIEPINKRLDNIEQDIKALQSDVKNIKKTTKRIDGKLDAGFNYLDSSIEKVDRRLAYKTMMLNKTDIGIMQDMSKLIND